MISIICPTVKGREQHLARCREAYETRTAVPFEFIEIHDLPTCSQAWNLGITKARGEFIHLTADDLEPHAGWDMAAGRVMKKGLLPEARILEPDGSLFSCGADGKERPDWQRAHFGRIPFFPRTLLESVYPIFPGHYYGDVWISERARKAGIETVICREYLFTHHWATEGRHDTLDSDWADYQQFILTAP